MTPSSSSFARLTAALREVGSAAAEHLADRVDRLQGEQPELEVPGEYLLSWVRFDEVDQRAQVGTIEGYRSVLVRGVEATAGERVLTIGYVSEFGVFVGWP